MTEPIPSVLARRIRSDNRFFTHVEEDLPDRQGKTYTYHQIESHWDAVIVVPLDTSGRLIIERIYRHPYRQWFYEFPAGGIEPGEDSLTAAARELEEETGYQGQAPRLLQSIEAMPGLLRMRLHIVRIDNCQLKTKPKLEAMEMLTVESHSIDQAWALAEKSSPSSFLMLGLWALSRDMAVLATT